MTRGQHQTIVLKFEAVYKPRTSSVCNMSSVCECVYQSMSSVCTFDLHTHTRVYIHTQIGIDRQIERPSASKV